VSAANEFNITDSDPPEGRVVRNTAQTGHQSNDDGTDHGHDRYLEGHDHAHGEGTGHPSPKPSPFVRMIKKILWNGTPAPNIFDLGPGQPDQPDQSSDKEPQPDVIQNELKRIPFSHACNPKNPRRKSSGPGVINEHYLNSGLLPTIHWIGTTCCKFRRKCRHP
jgi:hypothetical protein